MKYGVIDVGSNSVRLMISENGKTLYKLINTTKLAEGMGEEKTLKKQSVERTVSAVSFFVDKAKEESVDKLFIFATAAVRLSVNPEIFTEEVFRRTGYKVDVVSGDTEALIGRIGALGDKDGGVVDIGGASAEIIVVENGVSTYSKSLSTGVVRIKDFCGQDRIKSSLYLDEKMIEYGNIPHTNFYAIGGTATTLGAVFLGLEPYDPAKIHGLEMSFEDVSSLVDKLYSLSVEERKKLKGMHPLRAEVIAGGALFLMKIMQKIKLDKIIVSESDNLEGYLSYKTEKK